MVKQKEKKMNRDGIFACLLILWSVVFCKDQITFIWLREQIYLSTFRGSKSVRSQFCNDSVLSALCSFGPQHISALPELFLISHSPLCPAAANATILVALTRPYAQPLSQNAASVRNVSAIS